MDSAKPIPTSQEVNTTTLIVGSGICGLSTAYNLAKRQPKDGQTHRIIVIDALEDVFGAASSLNSGIVAYQWFTGDLRDTAEYSYKIYEQLAQADSTFKRTCGYHAHSILKLVPGRSSSPAQVPTWLNVPGAWHVEEDPGKGRAAALDPSKLGQWLAAECSINKVELYTRARLVKVDLSSDGILEYAHIHHSGETYRLGCQNLVLATGPWTPMLFQALFPESDCPMYPTTSSANWIIVDDPTTSGPGTLGQVVINDKAGNRLEVVGRGDGKIWLCGLNDNGTAIGDVEDVIPPDRNAMSELQSYAHRFIACPNSASSMGRTFRPTISRELPIIANVPFNKLCANTGSNFTSAPTMKGKRKTGVWVLFGHGKHGLALGMGSGALMSQLILGLSTDLDIDKFGFPD